MFKKDINFILASASPRRVELLTRMGLTFKQQPADTDEHIPYATPDEYVKALALKKARAVFDTLSPNAKKHACVIGSDTVVVLNDSVLGKPKDIHEATGMLHDLSGKTHTVYTGVALVYADNETAQFDTTDVTFASLTDEEIAAYIATGEPMDKAGAYGVQGSFCVHVVSIRGSYFTVMGLPVHVLYNMLKDSGMTE